MLEVTSAAADRSLLTLDELREAIGVSSGQDAALTTLGSRVAAVICKHCCIADDGVNPATLRKETLRETLRYDERRPRMVLSRRPIVAITSITESDTPLESDEYEVESARVVFRLYDDQRCSWPRGKIVVVYQAGFENVPDDLKLAAAKLAAIFWAEGLRSDPNLKRVEVPGVVTAEYWVAPSSDPAIPQEVCDLLAPYVNHWVG